MSGKKKKAFISPKYGEMPTLYDRLKNIKEVSLVSDQVQNHIGPGPTIIKEDALVELKASLSGSEDLERLAEDLAAGRDTDVRNTASSYEQSGLGSSESLSDSLSGDLASQWLQSDAETDAAGDPADPPPPDISVEGDYIQGVPPGTGIYHTPILSKHLNYNRADNELVMQNEGSYIVLGTDRPTSNKSGYGGKGYQNANTIDLVVGRLAASKGTKGPADGTYADNNPAADAARVYISQLTDVDVMFGLDGGVSGVATGGSAVGIKADDIRIIGQRSIKIVTGNSQGVKGGGRKGEWTSLGFNMHQPAPTIELLAGNRKQDRVVWGGIYNPIETISTVQRACLGGNTRDALNELNKTVGEIWSALFNLALIQAGYNANIGVDPFRPWVAAAAPVVGIANLDAVLGSLWHTKMNAILWEMNYLTPYGYKFICSTNIKLS